MNAPGHRPRRRRLPTGAGPGDSVHRQLVRGGDPLRHRPPARGPSPRRTRWTFRSFLAEGFAARVIAFESTCAEGYAAVRVRRESADLPVSIPDAMIAGTALAHGATVATRNVADFSGCGIAVANPWDGA